MSVTIDDNSINRIIKKKSQSYNKLLNNILDNQSINDDEFIEWLMAYEDYKVHKKLRPALYKLLRRAVASNSQVKLSYEDLLPISRIESYGSYQYVDGNMIGFEPEKGFIINYIVVFVEYNANLHKDSILVPIDKIQKAYGEDTLLIFGWSDDRKIEDINISVFVYK